MEKISLASHVKSCYRDYLTEVVSQRALSDCFDGLKPAQRRLIWATHTLGVHHKHSHVKSARITGECMGRLHPHSSSYSVLVGMSQACSVFPLIDGQGGWGFLGDASAASAERYTEARLSKLADEILLDKDYLAVTKMIPNYDDTTVEPLRLPAKLPLLLLLGSSGIAVGTRANIPAFTFESLKPVLMLALKREVTAKDCVNLKIHDMLNAIPAYSKQDWASYLKTGKGTLKMTAKLKIEGKTIRILSLAQNIDSALDKLERQEYVRSVSDMSTMDGVNILVRFKPQYKEADMKELAAKLTKLLTNSLNYSLSTNVVRTKADIDVKTASKTVYKTSATYIELSIAKLINMWTKWRVDLEKRMLANRIAVAQAEIDKLKLFIYAISKLDIIFKVLKKEKKDLDAKLAKALKITTDQAKQILDKSVRSLSSMSKDRLLSDIKKLQASVNNDKRLLSKPRATVHNWLKNLEVINKN